MKWIECNYTLHLALGWQQCHAGGSLNKRTKILSSAAAAVVGHIQPANGMLITSIRSINLSFSAAVATTQNTTNWLMMALNCHFRIVSIPSSSTGWDQQMNELAEMVHWASHSRRSCPLLARVLVTIIQSVEFNEGRFFGCILNSLFWLYFP